MYSAGMVSCFPANNGKLRDQKKWNLGQNQPVPINWLI